MKLLIALLSVITLLYCHDSPYSLEKFVPILKITKLQAPKSKYNPLYSVKQGNFAYYENRYFYLQDNKYMTFYMCGYKNRSELREVNDWKVNSETPLVLNAKVKIFPLNAKREFTFLQIHADSTLKNSINKPLLRIVWKKELHNLHNHIWAVIRTSANIYKQKYKKVDLGLMPKEFFNVKITVANSKLNILINNHTLIKNFDISYWDKYYNYFKAGVYLQDEGCAKVLFDKLTIKGKI